MEVDPPSPLKEKRSVSVHEEERTSLHQIPTNLTKRTADGMTIISEDDCATKLGFNFSQWKKWRIIIVIFLVQISMNYNASVYGNAVKPMEEKFGIAQKVAVVGQAVFLIAYAFGCELWAPWSEELGRRKVLQLSLFFVNLWQIPCAIVSLKGGPFAIVVFFRALGGLSSAGGSVTLAMVADMWGPKSQQYAIAFVVLSSVAGSIVGPIAGGFIEKYLALHWNFWIQLLFGAVVQLIHFVAVPETRTSCIVTAEVEKRRNDGERNIISGEEVKNREKTWSDVCKIWYRPFKMLATEPIVTFLSLLSGFSDALIFTFLDSYGKVYRQWGFDSVGIGFSFFPIGIGYIIAYVIWVLWIRCDLKRQAKTPNAEPSPEHRLKWLMWTAPGLVIGCLVFAWTSTGPPIPWWATMLPSILIGIANYAIYGATIDYMVAAYGGHYSACATGGNGFARDFLAGLSALYADPLYKNIGDKPLAYASTVLGCLAFVLIIPIYVFYYYGAWFRERSKYAQEVQTERKQADAVMPK